MIGKTLAHFEITAQLGKGGMGEVWRATDSRLDREIAIKVLPELFTAEPERLARFEREARVLASLTHPNIAAIHDSGEQDGQHFLVMELAPGETLAARIERGPLPAEEALAIAGQIASAVSAANDQGVVHRDLKPGNVMVAPDGKVKVLDFGLAKALTPIGASGSAPELSLSPTLTFEATAVGMLLGTAAYMSPEQAKGKPVDHHPRFSDDGSRIAFTIGIGQRGAGGDIWTYSLTSQTLSRLTFDQAGIYPLWSPGSEDIAFAGTGTALRSKPSDGAGATRTIVRSEEENFYFPGACSPDGGTIACSVSRQGTSIFLVEEDGSPLLFETDAHSPAFSPDGRWLAYAQPATGPAQIFVRPVDGEGKWQISTGSGESPRWTTQSGELFFLRNWEQRRQLMVVEVDEGKGLHFGPPRVVVDDTTDFRTITAPLVNWDVRPDGKTFVFVQLDRKNTTGTEVQVVLNWGSHLELPTP